ncbi:DNA-methyltransferase [Clostridium botulinum]|nr:site-specific DNA-methyltransferase [Clostridium botulinum]
MDIEINKIYNMDCLEGMDLMMKQGIKVDAIITDPPYNVSRDNNFKTMGRAGINFGNWDKDFNLTSWIKISEPLLKKGGNIIIFNDWKNMTDITKSLEDNGFIIKDLIRWEKTNPMPRNRDRRFITDYEVAVWAVKKGGKWTFNRKDESYERPEVKCGVTPQGEKKLGSHPTQKPIAVMQWIIERLTNENNVVLDPFIGSGTTAIACENLHRDYIGFELDNTYYNIANKRIG